MDFKHLYFVRTLAAVLAICACAGTVRAQGEGPHNLPFLPVETNVVIPMGMWLSGNFNPQQTVLIPGASVDVIALPLTYVRTFSTGGVFTRLFITLPFATLDGSGTVNIPAGGPMDVTASATGVMDPILNLHIGLVGTPVLSPLEFSKHPKSFQLLGILGTTVPIGHYSADRPVNLGTNRWSFRVGAGAVVFFSNTTSWESANSVFFFTDNNAPYKADVRSQDPLFVSENHFTHSFSPVWWGSIDLRYQIGGETATDGVPDDNRTNMLGGGVSIGHQFTPHLGAYASYGRVLFGDGDAKESMVRLAFMYSF